MGIKDMVQLRSINGIKVSTIKHYTLSKADFKH